MIDFDTVKEILGVGGSGLVGAFAAFMGIQHRVKKLEDTVGACVLEEVCAARERTNDVLADALRQDVEDIKSTVNRLEEKIDRLILS